MNAQAVIRQLEERYASPAGGRPRVSLSRLELDAGTDSWFLVADVLREGPPPVALRVEATVASTGRGGKSRWRESPLRAEDSSVLRDGTASAGQMRPAGGNPESLIILARLLQGFLPEGRVAEGDSRPARLRALLDAIAIELLRQGAVSVARAAEVARRPLSDMRRIAEASGVPIRYGPESVEDFRIELEVARRLHRAP